jgi:hypothetical protein
MLHESIQGLKVSTVVNSYKKTGFNYEMVVNERSVFLQSRDNDTVEGKVQRTSRPIASSPNAGHEKFKALLSKTQNIDPIQQLEVKISSFQQKVSGAVVRNA